MTKELSDKKIEAGWEETFSTNNPFCPCDLKSFTKAVKWAERSLAVAKAAQPTEDDEMSLIESQIDGLLEGDGASEDHADVMAWLAASGLRESLVARVHRAISCFERDHLQPRLVMLRRPRQLHACRPTLHAVRSDEVVMNYQEMVKWVFEAMLNGFMAGRPLRSVAEDIVIGLSNIIQDNMSKQRKPK